VSLIDRVRSLRVELASLDPGLLSVTDAGRLVSELASLKNACGAAEVRAAARAGRSAEELARVNGSSVGAAKAAIETVAALGSCPQTAAAVASGELSLEQAHEITKTEAARPGSERELLHVARQSGLRTLKDQARKRRHQAIGIDDVHRQQVAARSFRHWKNELGNIAFCGELPPESGVRLVNRLEAETDRVRRDAKKTDDPLEERDAYRADAFVRMFDSGGGRRAPSTEMILVLDYVAALRGYAVDGEVSHIIGGGDIPVEMAKELSKDALVKMVIHDGVNPLRVKHFNRHRPAELDTVLKIGPPPDFTGLVCDEDGCERQGHLEIDHINPLANRGPTSYANLRALCWIHHQEKTERDRQAGLLDGRGRAGPAP
jgi:hypothetical protein